MNYSKSQIIQTLISKGNELLNSPFRPIQFTKNTEADTFLNNIQDFPHAFVLACVMDRQIKAERAWIIPYTISQVIGSFEFSAHLELSLAQLKDIFVQKGLHRFNDIMAESYFAATSRIHSIYHDDASKIWSSKPKSATVVKRFLQFKGVGIKIATMATNILAREFKVPMSDYICVDISPDRQVKRVFRRLGLISKDAGNDELIYTARELNPLYPGIFDLPCWEIGRNWCKPKHPQCDKCYLSIHCLKQA